MRNHFVNGNQLSVLPPSANLVKLIEMNVRNWFTLSGEPRKTKIRNNEIGRISTPVNPPVARQHHQPIRMSYQQMERMEALHTGMVIFNTDEQICKMFDGASWRSILHYPGERYSGGIVLEVNDEGSHGLLTTISNQNTTVQWKDSYHRIPVTNKDDIASSISNKWQLQILRGINFTYAVRMASHYCVTANGEMIRGWRIPTFAELLPLLQDPIISASFKTGAAWAFQEHASISWLQILPNSPSTDQPSPDQYFVRLVRPF
jgi:hypothetical protein